MKVYSYRVGSRILCNSFCWGLNNPNNRTKFEGKIKKTFWSNPRMIVHFLFGQIIMLK